MNSHSSRDPESKCLSDYQLDCLALQSADALPEAPPLATHLVACPTCQARLAEARNALPPPDLNRLLRAAEKYEADNKNGFLRRAGRVGPQLTLVAAAAAAALFLWPKDLTLVTAEPQTERTKGSALHLNVIRHTPGGHIERVLSGEVVAANDSLRFEVESPRDAYVSVVSIDASHAVTAFVPPTGNAMFLEGKSVALLEGAVVLDDVSGVENIFLVACHAPFEVSEVVRLLSTVQDPGAYPNNNSNTLTLAQGACDLHVVSLKKQVKQ